MGTPRDLGTPPEGDAHNLPRDEVRTRSLTGVFFLTFSSVINLVVGFGANLVLAWILLPKDFGIVAIGSTAMLIGGALADGGLGAGMVRRPEAPTRAELRTLNGIQLVLSLALCLPVAAVALAEFGHTGAVTALMIISLPITTLQTPGRITLTRGMQFDRQVIADTGSMVISQVVTVIAVVLGAGVWGLASGAVVKALTGTAIINRLSTGWQWPSLRGWRKFGPILAFGIKFQASFYTFLAREQGLNIVLAVTVGVVPLGIWTFTNRIFQLPSLMFNSLYVVGFPAMSNVLARGEDIGPIILRTVRRTAIVGTFIFATFGATSPVLIPVVFGAKWEDAASIVPFISLSTLMLGSISVSAASYLPAVGRPGIVAIASACLGVVWLSVTAALISSIGVAAIGIGNLAGSLAEAIVLNAATKKSAGVAPYRPLVRPLAVALVSGGLGWLICFEGPQNVVTALAGASLTLAFATVGLWLTCREDLADTVRLASESLRKAVPQLRKTSAQAV
jgi:O-antigen/teichoic acid export membrane protein